MRTELEPRYYLNNFHKLIEHSLHWYEDLLIPEEQAWISRFLKLNEEAQCLLVRLYSRKGELFRSDKLNYPEIGDLAMPVHELRAKQFISLNPPISTPAVASQLLTKPELLSIYPQLSKLAKKHESIDALKDLEVFDYTLVEFDLVQLQSAHLIHLLLTLFFANTHQDLSQFVLDDLGLHQFEAYELSKERRFFTSRDQIEQLLLLHQISIQYSDIDRKDRHLLDMLYQQLPMPIDHPYVDRKREHLINDIARDYERIGCYQIALTIFEETALPPSRERKARILDRLDRLDEFSDTVTEMLANPYDKSEHEVATKLDHRLQRRLGNKVPRASKPKHDSFCLELDLSELRVELAAKNHIEKQGHTTYYSENNLLNGLFGLAFWPVIFAPVEGAFVNAYQYRPLDLYQDSFITTRLPLINEQLNRFESNGLSSLLDTYQSKHGIANPFVNWNSLPLELVETALSHFPADTLIALFRVMLSDLKLYRSGMPDLITFKKGQYHWVEVKGPGDKLQDSQWRWIHEFNRLNINFSVCYVNQ